MQPYRVWVYRCPTCDTTVRAPHPDLAPDQYGATAHRMGPRVMAAAHATHYGLGVPVRKVPAVLQLYTGVHLTQSAITQDALRRVSGPIGREYQALRDQVPTAEVVYTDDTGWRVGGEPAQLMIFVTDTATVFQVRAQHRNEEVREVIGDDYPGVLVTDRGKSYDAKELEAVKQQKCIPHALRSINEVLETKQGRARHFGARLKGLLKEGLQLWHEYHDHRGQLAGFERACPIAPGGGDAASAAASVGGRGQPAAAGPVRPAPRAGQSAAVPGGPAGRADEQRLRAWVPVRGDPAEGVAVLEDGGGSGGVRGVRQCDQDGDASGEGCGGAAERDCSGGSTPKVPRPDRRGRVLPHAHSAN